MSSRAKSMGRVRAALILCAATAALGMLNLECGNAAYEASAAAPTMAERPSGALAERLGAPPALSATAQGAPPGNSVADATPASPVPALPPPPTMAERPGGGSARIVPGPPSGGKPTDPRLDPAALHQQAEAYRQKGEPEHAEPLYQRALELLGQTVGDDHPRYAAVLNDLAEMYREQGKYAQAEPIAQRALDIRDRKLGPAHADSATSADNLAWLLWQRGEYRRAEPLAERALAAREGALGKGHPIVAISLTTLGVLLWDKGDYTHAEPLLVRALDIEKQTHGAPQEDKNGGPGATEGAGSVSLSVRPSARGDIAIALANLGGLYWDKGDYARAEPLFQRALDIQEKEHGKSDVSVAIPLSFLAQAALEREDYARAEKLALRALGIWEVALGQDHPKVASALISLGELYLQQGEHARAEPLFQRAADIWEKTLGKAHPLVADCSDDLATLYREKGDLKRARPLAELALAIRQKALGPAHPLVAAAFNHLSALSLAEGNLPAALEARERGAAILDHHAAILLAAGSEDQKRAYMAKLQKATDETISLHLRSAPSNLKAARLALTTLLRRKGRVLDAMIDGLAALRQNLTPEAQALLGRLASVEAQLGAGVLRGQGRISGQQYHTNIAALEAERQQLEAEVSARSARFRAAQRPVTIEEVQAAIPDGAALVEISLFSPFDAKGRRPEERHGKPRYAVYVLRRSGAPSFLDLGEAEAMDKAVADLREELASPVHDPRPRARALDARLMQPIRALLGDTRRVLLSPDSALTLIPFGALVDEEGRYLIERWSFTYLTTGRDLLRALPSAPAREQGLVLADPDFGPLDTAKHEDDDGPRRSVDIIAGIQFFRLRGTEAEGLAVTKRLAGARLLTGREASERAIKAAHGPRVVHIATHGFFLPAAAEPPSAATEGDPSPAPPKGPRGLDNPLLRAGLAFAGANQRESDGEDGVLTALEASSLDLHGTRLVVLSACETGIGDAERSEGVYGLRRALVIAGAETQVMSLWKVDDSATRSLMVAYYTGLSEGGGRSESMRHAQLSLLAGKATAHPYFWASFVVSGDGSPLSGALNIDALKVRPGARGCGCIAAGEGDNRSASLAICLAGLAIIGRRRRLAPR